MVLDSIPQILPVQIVGSRPQPPTSPYSGHKLCVINKHDMNNSFSFQSCDNRGEGWQISSVSVVVSKFFVFNLSLSFTWFIWIMSQYVFSAKKYRHILNHLCHVYPRLTVCDNCGSTTQENRYHLRSLNHVTILLRRDTHTHTHTHTHTQRQRFSCAIDDNDFPAP